MPASGWYEWQASPTATDGKGKPLKQPFYTARADGDVCAFAGLYEFWRDPDVPDADDPASSPSQGDVRTPHSQQLTSNEESS